MKTQWMAALLACLVLAASSHAYMVCYTDDDVWTDEDSQGDADTGVSMSTSDCGAWVETQGMMSQDSEGEAEAYRARTVYIINYGANDPNLTLDASGSVEGTIWTWGVSPSTAMAGGNCFGGSETVYLSVRGGSGDAYSDSDSFSDSQDMSYSGASYSYGFYAHALASIPAGPNRVYADADYEAGVSVSITESW